jgi:hypothetical protein
MLKYALLVFFVGALGGLFMATFVLRGKLAPWVVSLLHALLGASGLVLLFLGILNAEGGMLAMVALGVLVVTALFGFYLATMHMHQRVALKKVVLTHAGFAVTGVTTLIIAILMS